FPKGRTQIITVVVLIGMVCILVPVFICLCFKQKTQYRDPEMDKTQIKSSQDTDEMKTPLKVENEIRQRTSNQKRQGNNNYSNSVSSSVAKRLFYG
ncbi:hypothetical protein ILYODFUR_036775, partial [Ilyodon furcidens]